MMKKALSVCLIWILLAQIAVMIYYGNAKQGFHMDEILSFQISNLFEEKEGYHIGHRSDLYDRWHETEYFADAVMMQEENAFDFSGVCQNLKFDNHPVFFNVALSAACSLFPGVFSKWLGIVPNILYFLLTQIVLYAIGRRLGKSAVFGLLLVAAYGFSAAAISNVVFIRMYAMVMLWSVMQIYCHLQIYEDFTRKKWYVLAGFLTFLGLNTHYYFLIFQFFVSACCFSWMLARRSWKNAAAYAASIFAWMGVFLLLWPVAVVHITGGERGTEAFANLMSSHNYLNEFLANLNGLLANGRSRRGVKIFALLTLAAFVRKGKDIIHADTNRMTLLTMGVTVCGYVLMVSKIAPFGEIRYMLPVLPLLVTSVLWGFWHVMLKLLGNSKVVSLCLAIMIAAITFNCHCGKCVWYLFMEWPYEMDTVQAYRELDAVVLADTSWKTAGSMVLHLSEHPRTYVTNSAGVTGLAEATEDCRDGFFLYVEKDNRLEENLERIKEAVKCSAEEVYGGNEHFNMYFCSWIE